jgi:hypothetical protein
MLNNSKLKFLFISLINKEFIGDNQVVILDKNKTNNNFHIKVLGGLLGVSVIACLIWVYSDDEKTSKNKNKEKLKKELEELDKKIKNSTNKSEKEKFTKKLEKIQEKIEEEDKKIDEISSNQKYSSKELENAKKEIIEILDEATIKNQKDQGMIDALKNTKNIFEKYQVNKKIINDQDIEILQKLVNNENIYINYLLETIKVNISQKHNISEEDKIMINNDIQALVKSNKYYKNLEKVIRSYGIDVTLKKFSDELIKSLKDKIKS